MREVKVVRSSESTGAKAMLLVLVAWRSAGTATGLRTDHHRAKMSFPQEQKFSTILLVAIATVFADVE